MDWTDEEVQDQADARQHFIENPPDSFLALPEKDKKSKLLQRQVIETNWQCDIQNSIPESLLPRAITNKRMKKSVGEEGVEEMWWLWGCLLLSKLARLSKLTAGRWLEAGDLMLQQAQDRRRDMTHRMKHIAEILPGDLDVLNDRLIKQYIQENGLDDDMKKIKQEPVDEGPDEHENDGDIEAVTAQPKPNVKREIISDDDDEPTAVPAKKPATQPVKRPRTEHTNDMAGVATLKAKAARYKQESARLEAEAFELEARLMSGK